MKRKTIISAITCLLLLFFIGNNANAQLRSTANVQSITIEASQQVTNFVFVDGRGIQDNTRMIWGKDNVYKPVYSGAYNLGYSYLFGFGLYLNSSIGMRNAGATMVYDETNYEWNFQYLQAKLGAGYALKLGRVSPYIGVSGFFGYLAKASQSINNEEYDIIELEVIEPYDIGISVPIGVRLDASEYISIYTQASYLTGLQNIEALENDQQANNIGLSFTLGLSFTIK